MLTTPTRACAPGRLPCAAHAIGASVPRSYPRDCPQKNHRGKKVCRKHRPSTVRPMARSRPGIGQCDLHAHRRHYDKGRVLYQPHRRTLRDVSPASVSIGLSCCQPCGPPSSRWAVFFSGLHRIGHHEALCQPLHHRRGDQHDGEGRRPGEHEGMHPAG